MSEYLTEVQLPSKGIFYGDKLPDGLVQIEPMGTKQEKLFTTGKSGIAVLNKIYKDCIPLPFSHKDLILGDRLFLLLQLRAISYDNNYEYPYACEECGEKNWGKIDLFKMPIKSANDSTEVHFNAELPLTGKTLQLRLLTGADEESVTRYGKQMKSKIKGMIGGIEHTYRLARRLVTIDGEKVGIQEAMRFVEELKGKDSMAIQDALAANDIGPVTDVEPECESCNYANGPFTLPLSSEFFRPRRHRTKDTDYFRAAEVFDNSR